MSLYIGRYTYMYIHTHITCMHAYIHMHVGTYPYRYNCMWQTCMGIQTCKCMHILDTSIHAYTCIYTYLHTYTYMLVSRHAWACVCKYKNTYYRNKYLCTHLYVYILMYIYMHT